jgi:hypothetical protein
VGVLSVATIGRDMDFGAEGHACVWSVTAVNGRVQVAIQGGAIDSYHPGGGWEIGRPPSGGAWDWRTRTMKVIPSWDGWGWSWVAMKQQGGWQWFAAAPLWVGAAGLVGGGAGLVWWGRRARGVAGLCAGCGYDLKGLASGVKCPECGKAEA